MKLCIIIISKNANSFWNTPNRSPGIYYLYNLFVCVGRLLCRVYNIYIYIYIYCMFICVCHVTITKRWRRHTKTWWLCNAHAASITYYYYFGVYRVQQERDEYCIVRAPPDWTTSYSIRRGRKRNSLCTRRVTTIIIMYTLHVVHHERYTFPSENFVTISETFGEISERANAVLTNWMSIGRRDLYSLCTITAIVALFRIDTSSIFINILSFQIHIWVLFEGNVLNLDNSYNNDAL